MVIDIISRVAMSAAQKAGATVATKVATSAAATFAGCLLQMQIIKAEQAKLQEKAKAANEKGEILSQDEITKAQTKAFGEAAVASGAVAGVGLVANNAIANAIRSL